MAPRTVLLMLSNLLIPVAILIFATGFFPYKPFMPGLAEYEELHATAKDGSSMQQPPEAPFDKLVFMVVDALRSDFVYSAESGMSFVQRYNCPLDFDSAANIATQSHPRRYSASLHSPRYISHHHDAPCQSHNHRLDPILPRRDPELRRIRYDINARNARHLARPD